MKSIPLKYSPFIQSNNDHILANRIALYIQILNFNTPYGQKYFIYMQFKILITIHSMNHQSILTMILE